MLFRSGAYCGSVAFPCPTVTPKTRSSNSLPSSCWRSLAGPLVCECAVANLRAGWQNDLMKTLAEIERAAEELPPAERTELLLFVARSLRQEQAPLPQPRLFSDEQLQAWMDEDEEAMRRFRAGA